MSEVVSILDGLKDKDKRKAVAKKLIEENVKAKYNIQLPIEELRRGYEPALIKSLINELFDALAESVSYP